MKYLFLILLCACDTVKHNPVFKVGDCVAYDFDTPAESWQTRPKYEFSYKIVEIGNKNYRLLYWYGSKVDSLADRSDMQSMGSFIWIDNNFTKINCDTLNKE